MRLAAALALVLLAGCSHTAPLVKTLPGPVCVDGSYPADVPCVEKGQPAPKGGLLVEPQLARDWLAAPVAKQAENDSLKKSNALDVGLVGAAVVAVAGAFIAGFELGRAVH